MTHPVQAAAFQFVALFGTALGICIAAERLCLPAAVLLAALGTIAGALWHIVPPFQFSPVVLFVFLPPLIFEAAWRIDARELIRQWGRIAFLAVPGTLLSAAGIAGGLAGLHVLPFGAAAIIGAIVAATDPVAVVAVFRSVPVPPAIATIVEAESLANDGIAIVLYGMALAIATSGAGSWGAQAFHGAYQLGAGCAIGAVCAVPIWLALRVTDAPEYEIAATVALAYVAYLAASYVDASGIFASAGAAIGLRLLLARRPARFDPEAVGAFWSAASYMTNAVVFLATGLIIQPGSVLREPLVVGITLLLALAIRAALSYAVVRSLPERVTIFMAGMRGALPLALALALPPIPWRETIVDAVYAVVLFTLVVQGIPLRPLTARFFGGAMAS